MGLLDPVLSSALFRALEASYTWRMEEKQMSKEDQGIDWQAKTEDNLPHLPQTLHPTRHIRLWYLPQAPRTMRHRRGGRHYADSRATRG